MTDKRLRSTVAEHSETSSST